MSKIVKVMPGKMYAVECSSPVTVMNVLTGTVVAQGDGSAQVFFVACAEAYEFSSDSAIVTEVFKLAPRRKLTLLQGVAGGLLPKGYVELEYLKSSGTQYIDTGIVTDGTYTIACRMQISYGSSWGRAQISKDSSLTEGTSWARYLSGNPAGLHFYYRQQGAVLNDSTDSPWDKALPHNWVAVEGRDTVTLDGQNVTTANLNGRSLDARNPGGLRHFIFWANGEYPTGNGPAGMQLYRFTMSTAKGVPGFDGVPVLNADGVAGLFDRVSKRFLSNAGSGTFGWQIKNVPAASAYTLRGRSKTGYMPPSGVWARPAGVNGLELVADTEEVSGAGWLHFPDTAEAYEHFGITQEEILTE